MVPAPQTAPPITHVPMSQRSLGPHAFPQKPQFVALICVLTHSPPQFVVPVGHVTDPTRHTPAMHDSVGAHAFPHTPQ